MNELLYNLVAWSDWSMALRERNVYITSKHLFAYPLFKHFFFKLSSALKIYNIFIIPIVDKSLNSVAKFGKVITNTMDRANVVYQFSCENCEACYIRKTKRS